ncbi:hypothetical protein KFK09_024092 [Dendrobium nobile]|uniref:Uncharacterized protein n=1 Tax=Dendrobium nobile TaxID=94219 RepID=A0A8T3ADW0_DENNO|nr:hypothetical protein KFK09_024092 [Dendrobium nobile]
MEGFSHLPMLSWKLENGFCSWSFSNFFQKNHCRSTAPHDATLNSKNKPSAFVSDCTSRYTRSIAAQNLLRLDLPKLLKLHRAFSNFHEAAWKNHPSTPFSNQKTNTAFHPSTTFVDIQTLAGCCTCRLFTNA